MSTPKTEPLYGRSPWDEVPDPGDLGEPRAQASPVLRCEVGYVSGATGTNTVEVFESRDHAGRGGVILRFRTSDGGSSFFADAIHTKDGVDLHLAGQAEAAAFIDALKALLAAYKRRPAGDTYELDEQVLGKPTITRLDQDEAKMSDHEEDLPSIPGLTPEMVRAIRSFVWLLPEEETKARFVGVKEELAMLILAERAEIPTKDENGSRHLPTETRRTRAARLLGLLLADGPWDVVAALASSYALEEHVVRKMHHLGDHMVEMMREHEAAKAAAQAPAPKKGRRPGKPSPPQET